MVCYDWPTQQLLYDIGKTCNANWLGPPIQLIEEKWVAGPR